MRAPTSDLPVAFDNVALRIGEVSVVRELNLTLATGSTTVLLGPNG